MLTGKDGRSVDFAPFDPNIDAALFPLLFPYGQRTYERQIPLAKVKPDKQKPAIQKQNESLVYEEFSDDEEPEEDALDLIDHPGDEEEEQTIQTESAPDPIIHPRDDSDEENIENEADGEVTDCNPSSRFKVARSKCNYF